MSLVDSPSAMEAAVRLAWASPSVARASSEPEEAQLPERPEPPKGKGLYGAGIFGVAFWDARRRLLTLARDPLGVKQVYYHDDGDVGEGNRRREPGNSP